ncbi:hypothetical protein ACQ4PT_007723 [Festuca glaucescens]
MDGLVEEVNGEELVVNCTSGKKVTVNVSNAYPKDTESPRGGVEDMTRLAYLHEPGVLQNLKSRFMLNEIYSNPVLEAFGNAKTVRNNNSSRFGKFVEIQFDQNGKISGAAIRTYLLERSRVCQISDPERNYHCFYMLCAGPPEVCEKYKLGEAKSFHYLNQSNCIELNGMDDAKEYAETRRAMGIVGMSSDEQDAIFKVVAAILHLGNVEFSEGSEPDSSAPKDEKSQFHLKTAAELFMCDAQGLEESLCKRVMATRGESITKNLDPKAAALSRDALSRIVYSRLFDWLVNKINSSIGQDPESKILIGVLDIYGFESFKTNSFEQFCINLTNEKLQQHFNQHVFKMEQEEYTKEEIDWSYIQFVDNQEILDLIEKQQLQSLLETLSATEPHYIRCIKPNNVLKPAIFENSNVLQQLRCGGVLEAIRISCLGYPTRRTFYEFVNRFGILQPKVLSKSHDEITASKMLLEKANLVGYQIGKTKVFLRAGQMAELDALRTEAAKETGALQAAKSKLEKEVEELTWRLQLEKRIRSDMEEAKTQEIKKLQSQLQESQQQVKDTEESLKREQEIAKAASEKAALVPEIRVDATLVNELTADNEKLKNLANGSLPGDEQTPHGTPMEFGRRSLIERQQESVETLINCVVENIGFSDGKPVAAVTIYKCLLHWRTFEAERTNVFDRLIQIFSSAMQVFRASSITVDMDLVRQVEGKYPAFLFKQQLTAFVEGLYGMIRDNVKREVSSVLSLVIQAPRTAKAGLITDQDSYWKAIVNHLNDLLKILQENCVPAIFARKIFSQIFAFINAQLFNSLLVRRECCSFSNGEYVKQGLEELEAWCTQAKPEYAGSAWDELKHISQAVGFLVIFKKFRISYDEIISDLCPMLSVQQLYRICTQYWDDKYNTESVSEEVLNEMKTLVNDASGQANSENTYLLDEETSMPLSLDEIASSMDAKEFQNVVPPQELLENAAFQFLKS